MLLRPALLLVVGLANTDCSFGQYKLAAADVAACLSPLRCLCLHVLHRTNAQSVGRSADHQGTATCTALWSPQVHDGAPATLAELAEVEEDLTAGAMQVQRCSQLACPCDLCFRGWTEVLFKPSNMKIICSVALHIFVSLAHACLHVGCAAAAIEKQLCPSACRRTW